MWHGARYGLHRSQGDLQTLGRTHAATDATHPSTEELSWGRHASLPACECVWVSACCIRVMPLPCVTFPRCAAWFQARCMYLGSSKEVRRLYTTLCCSLKHSWGGLSKHSVGTEAETAETRAVSRYCSSLHAHLYDLGNVSQVEGVVALGGRGKEMCTNAVVNGGGSTHNLRRSSGCVWLQVLGSESRYDGLKDAANRLVCQLSKGDRREVSQQTGSHWVTATAWRTHARHNLHQHPPLSSSSSCSQALEALGNPK